MASWEFSIWIGGKPNYRKSTKLRSYKRPHFVTRALPKIMMGFETYVEVKLNGNPIAIVLADGWLDKKRGVSDLERYFAEMMEEQREYERWQETAESEEDENAIT